MDWVVGGARAVNMKVVLNLMPRLLDKVTNFDQNSISPAISPKNLQQESVT